MAYNPLFWQLSVESQVKLIQFQYREYKTLLSIPRPPGVTAGAWEAVIPETLEEIEKLMRQPPSHQEKIG